MNEQLKPLPKTKSCFERTGKACTPDCSLTKCFWEKELKMCPFCAGEAELRPPPFDPFKLFVISCLNCHVRKTGYSWQDAIDAWNLRA